MIDYEKYTWHIKVLGSLEEFKESIEMWKELFPDFTDEEITKILDEEQELKIGPAFWCRPWN